MSSTKIIEHEEEEEEEDDEEEKPKNFHEMEIDDRILKVKLILQVITDFKLPQNSFLPLITSCFFDSKYSLVGFLFSFRR